MSNIVRDSDVVEIRGGSANLNGGLSGIFA
jgi:hypothetical protein